jgi:hypothetical protein
VLRTRGRRRVGQAGAAVLAVAAVVAGMGWVLHLGSATVSTRLPAAATPRSRSATVPPAPDVRPSPAISIPDSGGPYETASPARQDRAQVAAWNRLTELAGTTPDGAVVGLLWRPRSILLSHHGPLPEGVAQAVAAARRDGVVVELVASPWPLADQYRALTQLQDDPTVLRAFTVVWADVAADGSGLTLGVFGDTSPARARALQRALHTTVGVVLHLPNPAGRPPLYKVGPHGEWPPVGEASSGYATPLYLQAAADADVSPSAS